MPCMRDHSYPCSGPQQLSQACGAGACCNRVETAPRHEIRWELRHKLHVEQAAQPRYPVCLMPAHFEPLLQRAAHLEIVAIARDVLIEGRMARAVGALREEQNRTAGLQRPTRVLQPLMRLPQIDIQWIAAGRGDQDV